MAAPSANPPVPGYVWPLFLAVSGVLILRFLWAVLVTGGGWPLSPVHYMAMAADLGMTVGVIGVRAQLMAGGGPEEDRRRIVAVLFPLALIAGAGLLLIRFTSDAAWWTGHLYN